MDIVTIDLETFYDREYSLSKMTTESYVRDPRFEVIGLSIKVNNYPTDWYSGSNPGAFLRQLKYDDRAILSHNSAFDAAILSWHFGIKPKLWLDTLSMARGLGHAATTGLSLKALAAYYHLGQKGDEVHNALGKRRADFTPDEMARYGAYCTQDTDLTYALFRKLAKGFPPSEIQLIDLIVRMYTEPTIELDQGVLREHLTGVVARKEAILAKFDSPDARAILMSNPKFAEYLRSCGIEPPTKISKTTGKATFAFSKTDKEFLDLLEHPDERVSAAAAARLGTKSTIEETRTYSLLEVSKRGRLPILLNYYGAHCVPGDTEVLTPTGWYRLDEWTGGDVAQWHADSGKIEFIHADQYVGPIIDTWIISSAPYMPVEMTPGHTVPVLRHGSRTLKPIPAEELLIRGSSYIPTSGNLAHTCSITPEQARVLVMVQADGSFEVDTSVGRRLTIFVRKLRKVERARQLLTAAGVVYSEQTYPSHPGYVRFIVKAKDYPAWLSPDRKTFGPWVMDCPLDVFVDEIQHWDGWVQGGQVCYSTSDYTNAEWVQTAAHLAGKGCSISTREGLGNRRTNYNLRFRNRAECMVKYNHMALATKPQRAYCVTSKTGYWLARANGQIFITGNTGRLSGGGGLNLQNLPRGGAIRRALVAPKGKTLVVSDSAQIEARVVAWLAGQHDLVQSFAQKRDVYCEFASEVYGRPITKADKMERFLGKTCILGLGYSMGPVRFREALALGLGGMKLQITEAEAKRIVNIYRNKNHRITALWNRCSTALSRMLSGMEMDIAPEVLPSLVATRDGIRLPNGMMIRYPALQESGEGVGYVYASTPRAFQEATKAKILGQSPDPAKMARIYGPKTVENLVQALARIVVTDQMLEISRRYKIALQVHDEVAVVCDQDEAEECKAYVEAVMSKPPAWAPDLPVACEANYGTSYGEVK